MKLFSPAFIVPAAFCACGFLFWQTTPLCATSSGGDYRLESSASGPSGGALFSGGEYSVKGSLGQNIMPPNLGVLNGGAYVSRSGFYNPPHFTYQKGLASSLVFPGGNARLTLPAHSVNKEAFDIILNKNAAASPILAESGEIANANSKISVNEGARALPLAGNITEMCLFDEQDFMEQPFNSPGMLSLSYRDSNGDGVLDGSNPPVRTDTVRIWELDRKLDMWVKLHASAVDGASGVITVPFMTPGVYALLGTLDESVKNTYAFPVPFRPNGPQAGPGAGQTGVASEGITFVNVPQTGNIEIYTLDGGLVRKLGIPDNLVIPKVNWDVKNSAGEKAASGVYIWRVVSGSNVKSGKLMVIW
jgi:hypothetical protein